MSGEIEATGAAITAGLAASAIEETRTGKRPGSGLCVNCGQPLTGKFCANCGQPARLHHALLNMVEEFVRGLVLFDTRAWRTLVMLVIRPGTLTHEYLRGKRVRYVSPLAMFLFMVFAMFAALAFIGGSESGAGGQAGGIARISDEVKNSESEIARLNERITELTAKGGAAEEIDELKEDIGAETATLDALKTALQAARTASETPGGSTPEADGDSLEVSNGLLKAMERGEFSTGLRSIDNKLIEDLKNPQLALYKIQNAAYKFAFLLVPISLPFVWLMFMWRRGTTLFDHTVYILYSLSFVSLQFIAMSAVLALARDAIGFLAAVLVLGSPVHAYFHLKGGYGLSWFSALWRLPFQLVFSLIGLLLFILAIVALGLVG